MLRSQDPSPSTTPLHPTPLHQPALGPLTPPRVFTLRFVGPTAPLSPDLCFYTEADPISGVSLPLSASCRAALSAQPLSVSGRGEGPSAARWRRRSKHCRMMTSIPLLRLTTFLAFPATFPHLLFHCGGSKPPIALQPHG